MIKPAEDRLSYSKLLKPPVDYEVDFAVGTTYSLDLEALVGVPMAFSLGEEMESEFMSNPLLVLESLRRDAEKFILFCEGGQIKVPNGVNYVYSLLEESVCEVLLPNKHVFHPKVWVLKYKHKDKKEAIYRLLVLSRNLTFDRSWDLVVALEGKESNARKRKNKSLITFLNALLNHLKNQDKIKRMKEFIEAVSYVAFDSMNESYKDFSFYPLGIKGESGFKQEIFAPYEELFIISPFLGKGLVEQIEAYGKKGAKRILITRRTELVNLKSDLINSFDIYVLKDLIVDGEEMLSEDEKDNTCQKQDIHAKMYVIKRSGSYTFYIGSANCSNNAFGGNMEFMIGLDYKKRGFSIARLLEDLTGTDENENPFERITEIPIIVQGEISMEEQLQRAIKSLCREVKQAYVVKEDEGYRLHILFNAIPQGYTFEISPLQSPKDQLVCEETIIKGLQLKDLGSFYKVKAIKDNEFLERLIKIETVGIPENRNSEIFRSIVKDEKTFLKYISFLLADDFLLAILEEIEQRKEKSSDKWQTFESEVPILYEKMLKAVVYETQSLDNIGEVMKILQDDTIVPSEFAHLYHTFKKAVKKVKK